MKINKHIPVLATELINNLEIKENAVYIDCTLGRGGHSSMILEKLPNSSKLIAFDQDQSAIEYCNKKFEGESKIQIIKSNFKDIDKYIKEPVDGIIMDIGVSSPQLDNAKRGFSYHKNGILDMRMDEKQALNAKIIVNTYDEKELTNIFRKYGEEKYSSSISKKIVKRREEKEIETTLELVNIIKSSTPAKYKKLKHPAKKVFQALRIEVNQELDALVLTLKKVTKMLKPKGVLLVITFHSLEDRIVKTYFRKLTTPTKTPVNIPIIDVDDTEFILVNKKPIIACEKELKENNRSKSAKLRIIKKRG